MNHAALEEDAPIILESTGITTISLDIGVLILVGLLLQLPTLAVAVPTPRSPVADAISLGGNTLMLVDLPLPISLTNGLPLFIPLPL